jgi:hypothetical protein
VVVALAVAAAAATAEVVADGSYPLTFFSIKREDERQ